MIVAGSRIFTRLPCALNALAQARAIDSAIDSIIERVIDSEIELGIERCKEHMLLYILICGK